MRFRIAALLMCGFAVAVAQQAVEAVGPYVNRVYGYTVTIPQGWVGKRDLPPAPIHGF